MYYTVIKHNGHLRTRGKCRKHEPQASVFYISRVFSKCPEILRAQNNKKRFFYVLCTGNSTEWSPAQSVIIRVTKSDDCAAGVRFVYYEYGYRLNWTTREKEK